MTCSGARGATGASSQAKEDVVSERPPWREGPVVGERTWGEPCGRMPDPEGRCGGALRRGPGRNRPACMKPLGAGAGLGDDEYFTCAQSTLASARWCLAGGLVDVDRPIRNTVLPTWVLVWREAGFKDQGRAGPGAGGRDKKQADGKLSWRSCCGRLGADPWRVSGLWQQGTGRAV